MKSLRFTHDTIRTMGIHVLAVYMLLRCAEEEQIVPVQAQWILDHMPSRTSANTITNALRWLCSPERQIAVRVKGGWRLNRDLSFQLPLTYELPDGVGESSIQEGEITVIENLSGSENLPGSENRSESENLPERGNRAGRGFGAFENLSGSENRSERGNRAESCPLKKERILIQDFKEDSFFLNAQENRSESENLPESDFEPGEEPAQDPDLALPGVKEILFETANLFDGHAVYSSGIAADLPSTAVFAWLAHAWDQWPEGGRKGRLHSPVQFVYKKLSAYPFVPPSIEYLQGWKYILPDDWLERFGLVKYECDVCGDVRQQRCEMDRHMETHPFCTVCGDPFLDQEQLEEHLKTHKPAAENDSVTRPINGHMSAEQAWQSVLGQLQMEMPRASFDTWVRDTKAVDFDGARLSIGVRNDYARDWLENRLASTVSRLLVGVMNASVEVNFVTYESEGT